MLPPQTYPRHATHVLWASVTAWLANWLAEWQRIFMFGAMACVMVMSPSTYDQANRQAMARQIYLTTWRVLPWFTVLAGIFSWVLIRAVLVTAVHYGLAKFATDLMVKVLVLEVIPLFAALYVTLRNALSTNPEASGIYMPRHLDGLDHLNAAQTDRIRDELVPRVIAYGFSVLTMVVVSGLVTLVMAYASVYGLSPRGMPEFARTVGQAFDGVAALSFGLRVLLYGLAVAVIPIAAALNTVALYSSGAPELARARLGPGTARLLMSLFVIEALFLAVRFL